MLKKRPQKVAYLWQLGVLFLCSHDCPKQPRTSFPFYKFLYPIVSAKVSDWNTLDGAGYKEFMATRAVLLVQSRNKTEKSLNLLLSLASTLSVRFSLHM